MTYTVQDFLVLEEKVWQALVTGDASADTALLSEQFLGVYPSGFAGRSEHAGQLADGPVMAWYQLHDATLLPLGDDMAMLAYRACYLSVAARRDNPDAAPAQMMISSLWRKEQGQWRNLFSQDTPHETDRPG